VRASKSLLQYLAEFFLEQNKFQKKFVDKIKVRN